MSDSLMEFASDGDANAKSIEPPWVTWSKNAGKKTREEWFANTYPLLEKMSESRISTFANNLLWYTGEYEKTMEYRLVVPGRGEQVLTRKTLPRIFNHLFDITEQRASQMSRYKPSFDVVPTNREETDRVMAKLIRICLDAMSRRVQMDFLMQEIERWVAVFGECLLGIEWNSKIGDRKSRGSVERVGDVDVYLKAPWTYFPAPKRRWQDVDWCIDIWDVIHVEEAKKRYGKGVDSDGSEGVFRFDQNILPKEKDEVILYRVIQLPTEYLPEGNVTYFVNNKIVDEEEKFPYSHNEFPWERHTDIDVPGRLFPISFYQHLQPIQHVYNRLTSVMVRNALLVGHPHILNPRGSGVKREAFGNAPTEITYNPVNGVEPKIVTFSSIPQEFFQLRTEVKQELGQVSGTQNALRGNPPPGTRAASMLRWFEEQQETRLSTTIIKHNEFIRRTFWKAASVIGDYYPKASKDRLLRVLGRENEYLMQNFDAAKISSEYDVIILNSAGFSTTMSGRLEEISLITQIEKDTGQQILSPQEKADILEAKNPQKAYDIVTSAQKTADLHNEWFLSGKDVPEPKMYWDLLTHWRTTSILMNSPQWERVGEEKQKSAENHLLMLEDLMTRKAEKSPTFATKVMQLEGFPSMFVPAPTAAADPGPNATPPEGAPAGPPPVGAETGAMPGLPPATPAQVGLPAPMV